MTSSLEALPSELLSIIATFCVEVDHEDDDSFLRFFLISRTIQAATRQTWLLQYFTHRNVTLSPAKLTELIEVTANAEIARHVKAICVSSNDDSLEFNFEEHGLAPTAKAVKLGLLLGLVLQTLKHLTHVAFRRAETSTNANGNEHTSTFDFSATYSIVVLALETYRLYPEFLLTYEPDDVGLSITQCSAMPQLTSCLANLKTLSISLGVRDATPVEHPDGNTKLTNHLVGGFKLMQSLQQLILTFCNQRESCSLISELAKCVYLPKLNLIALFAPTCSVVHLTQFLCKHSEPLTSFAVTYIAAVEKDADKAYRRLFTKLRDEFNLKSFVVGSLETSNDEPFEFPHIDRTIVKDEPNEDGFINVDLSHSLCLNGAGEVKNGPSQMLSCMVLAR